MPISKDELSINAMGGTELQKNVLLERLGEEYLHDFQIIPSRVRDLDETKIRVLWCHDLPEDPETYHLANEGWRKFHKIVFVSNWQAQRYIEKYNIPWSHCTVIKNAIVPIEAKKKPSNKINLIYHTTPHRGLNILIPVFEKIAKTYDNVYLDVYSSFQIYGWEERDKQFEVLFDRIKNGEKMTYHGFKSNSEVKEALRDAHIFAYPSTWVETSCISLIEAMSAGCLCVHPNLGALYETAADWTMMYDWNDDISQHANHFYQVLAGSIELLRDNSQDITPKLKGQKSYVDVFYNWEARVGKWKALLDSLRNVPRELPQEMFRYSR